MFVIIQCMDNLDETLDPKEKVAQVSPSRNNFYPYFGNLTLSIYVLYYPTLSTGNETCWRGHHGDILHGCCGIFHRRIHGWISKLLLGISSTPILCRACPYCELSASLPELALFSSTSSHAHILLLASSWMSVEGMSLFLM